jgi:hypothetical protein
MRALMMATPGPRVSAAMAVARASGVTIVEGDVLHGLDVMTEHLAAATADHNRPWLPAAPWVPEAIRRGPEGLLSQSAAVYLSPSLAHRSAEVAQRFPGVPCIALVDCPALPALARPDASAYSEWAASALTILAAQQNTQIELVPLERLNEPAILTSWLHTMGGKLHAGVVQQVAALMRNHPPGNPQTLPPDIRRIRSALGADTANPTPDVPLWQVGGQESARVDHRIALARALLAAGLDREAAEAIAGARLLSI